MADSGEYQGSQAFGQTTRSRESINRNTGSLDYGQTLVNLKGVLKSIGLNVYLSYSQGLSGSFGLPQNWTLNTSFVIPNQSLSTQGRSYLIDFTWSDESGYQSGLRYVNNHGMKFEQIQPPQPLPSGKPGQYAWTFRQTDGAMDYFDSVGKLLEHADMFGNSIYFAYYDDQAGPLSANFDYIIDSWGQKVQFGYQPGEAIFVTAPDGSQTTITISPQGVQTVTDPLGYITAFTYAQFGAGWVLSTIQYPSTLTSQFGYQNMSYNKPDGSTAFLPAVLEHYHLDSNRLVLDHTRYIFGSGSNGSTYTGYLLGFTMGGSTDSLMESGNPDYRYDVLVCNLDQNDKIISASRVFYNYLHLPMQEFHYRVDDAGSISDAYKSEYAYDIPLDQHARATNYTSPKATEQFHYVSDATVPFYRPLRRTTATYDDFGSLVLLLEEQYDATANKYNKTKSTVNVYQPTSWGGEIAQSETFRDEITGYERQILHTLSSNQKTIFTSVTQYKTSIQNGFNPWKTKTYLYDSYGRVTSETLAWTSGVAYPEGSVASQTNTMVYVHDADSGTLTVSSVDSLNNKTTSDYNLRTIHGPVVKTTLPLGQSESFEYDSIGRLLSHTDPMGDKTTNVYSVGSSGNYVLSTTSAGYVKQTVQDPLGRAIKVEDNGDSTITPSSVPTRILSQTSYDTLSRVLTKTDELGLVTRFDSYDGLNRLLKTTDPEGNVTTNAYDDGTLKTQSKLNGNLRTETQLDSFGRTVQNTSYADSGDTTIDYCIVTKTTFDGFGLHVKSENFQKSLSTSSMIQLGSSTQTYDVESKVESVVVTGLSDVTDSPFDTLTRTYVKDIFGNVFTYKKYVKYSDGRAYTHQGPKLFYDSCGRFTTYRNQLGQEEILSYDANGYQLGMKRFNGDEVSYTTDALGRLTSVKTGGITNVAKQYQSNGRVSKVARGTAAVDYKYTLDGCASAVIFPGGRRQSYQLDKYARIVQSTDASGAVAKNTFDQFGKIASRTLAGDVINYAYGEVNHAKGQVVGDVLVGNTKKWSRTISYDGFGKAQHVTVRDVNTNAIVLDTIYLYNSRGKLISIELSSATSPDLPELNNQRKFKYDGFGQLVEDNITYTKTSTSSQSKYQYDGNSNLILSTTDGKSSSASYNSLDQRTDGAFKYDANGRLLEDGKRKYTFDDNDQLTLAETSSKRSRFNYHPNSAMSALSTDTNEQDLYYDGGSVNVIQSKGDNKDEWTSFLLEPGRRIAAYPGASNTNSSYYIESQGSTSALIGAKDNTTTASTYSTYGVATSQGATQDQFGFRQEFTDAQSGLVYLRSRMYQPENSSFVTMDSAYKENRYAYCRGDPINLMDGTGHDTAMWFGMAVGAVVTLAVGLATGGVGAVVFGPETMAASMSVAAVSGAAGNVSVSGFTALADHQKYTGHQAAEDILSGAVGGAIGAGSGGLAGSKAMELALEREMSQKAITAIGMGTSSVIGGTSGGFSSSATIAVLNGDPIFSENTAVAAAGGFIGGVGGGVLESGAYLGLVQGGKVIPVFLKDPNLIVPAVRPDGVELGASLYVMAPQKEAMGTFERFNGGKSRVGTKFEPNDALRKFPGVPGTEMYDTVAAHGLGRTVFASVRYGEAELAGPNHVRPMKGRLFAKHMADIQDTPAFPGTTLRVKMLTCFGAFSNAQSLADALQRDVWGSYQEIDRYSATTKWKLFSP